jgi:hypothetical protein
LKKFRCRNPSCKRERERILEVLAETMQVRAFHYDCIGREALAAGGVAYEKLPLSEPVA